MSLWGVRPDCERQQWILDPFVKRGPLRFGMSSDEASAALGGFGATACRDFPRLGTSSHTCAEAGLKLYFAADKGLCGVAADALCGPQLLADGVALVARAPSVLEQWLFDRADGREPFTEACYSREGRWAR
ncbi:hypothetical protein [Streptomyces erythrochromogenes]|uniref:hypothetical protein n=1 Tax=Streptomyces erythrochromogenes TaxID=285574 RepID=UPI00367419B0